MTKSLDMTTLSQANILSAIAEITDNPYATPHLKGLIDSAVMVILHLENDEWHVLFTKRSESLNAHAGQISFPGGRKDSTDLDFQSTARRETTEEIGIHDSHLDIVAELTPVCTLTGYRIFPYVCFIEQLPELTAELGEVEEIFSVPLSYLCETDNMREIKKHFDGRDFTTFEFLWESHNIWGATAHMVADLSYRIRSYHL